LARLILLTQPEFADTIVRALRAVAGALDLRVATTKAELEAGMADGVRLVSFGSGVIVPAALLARATAGAYNFHPGPPDYPGIFPSVFALYDGATRFGVTLHEMAALVDSGPIVAVDDFDIPPAWDRLALDTASFRALITLLAKTAPQLTDLRKPLPHITRAWGKTLRTRRDFDALCHLPEDVSAEEFTRRYRAVGEGPDHALTLTRDGQTYRFDNKRGSAVVRGGQPVEN